MQQKIKNLRSQHVGKRKEEVAAYQKFLREEFLLDKTEERQLPTDLTSSSSFEEEDKPIIAQQSITPKTWWLKFKDGDWLKSRILVGVVISVLFAALWGYVVLWSEQKAQNVKIDDLKNIVNSLVNKYDINNSKTNQIDKDISTFKVEVQKDIEFIKDKLNSIKK